jgi:hypothetical protein
MEAREAPIPTRSAVEKLDNAHLLKLFAVVSADVQRRIRNYVRGPDVAEVVLDGLNFAGVVDNITTDLDLGEGFSAGGVGDIDGAFFYAPQHLQEKLMRSSLAHEAVTAEWEPDVDDD